MQFVRWIGGGLLLALGAWCLAFNLYALFRGAAIQRRTGHNVSLVPILGGVLPCAALLVLPIPALARWWWIPFVVDPGSLLMCGGAVVVALSRRWRGSERT